MSPDITVIFAANRACKPLMSENEAFLSYKNTVRIENQSERP